MAIAKLAQKDHLDYAVRGRGWVDFERALKREILLFEGRFGFAGENAANSNLPWIM